MRSFAALALLLTACATAPAAPPPAGPPVAPVTTAEPELAPDLAESLDALPEAEENTDARQRAFEDRRRGRSMLRLAGVVLARAQLGEIASARLCALEHSEADAREAIAREKRIGAESGAVNYDLLRDAGEQLVDVLDEQKDLRAAMKRAAVRRSPCTAPGVKAIAVCLYAPSDCQDPDSYWLYGAASSAASALLGGADGDEMEASARGGLTAEDVEEAAKIAGTPR